MKKTKIKREAPIRGFQRQKELNTQNNELGISKQALDERKHLEVLLIELTEKEVEEGKKLQRKRFEEEIELRNGEKTSLKKEEDIITLARQPYDAKFPNSIPFFKEMYRLLGWSDKDPGRFQKPKIVGKYLIELIYARFHSDVLPVLQTLAMPGGVRKDKFYQYLNEEGIRRLEQYRDDAIELMKSCKTWYEFRVKYGHLYHLPVQKTLFEKYQIDQEEKCSNIKI